MHTQKTSQSRLAFANLLAGATLSNYNHSLQNAKNSQSHLALANFGRELVGGATAAGSSAHHHQPKIIIIII